MREIQQLSALRKALKAEFESMGHGEVVAGMQTLPGPAAALMLAQAGSAATGTGPGTQAAAHAAAPVDVPGPPHAQINPLPVQPHPLPQQQPQPQLQQQHAVYQPHTMVGTQAPGAGQWSGMPTAGQQAAPPPQPAAQQPQPAPPAPPHVQLQQPQPLLQWNLPGQSAAAPQPLVHPAYQQQQQQQLQQQQQQWVAPASDAAFYPDPASPDPHNRSFAFMPPSGPQDLTSPPVTMVAPVLQPHSGIPAAPNLTAPLQPLPIAEPVIPPPPASHGPQSPTSHQPPQPALQWVIPAAPFPAGPAPAPAPTSTRGVSPPPQRPSRTPSASSSPKPKHAPAPAKSPTAQSAGSYARGALDSPGATGTRTHKGALPRPSPASPAAHRAAAEPERPQVNEGSYLQAALEARQRAERERAAKEALKAESAAAKAAALQRSKSDRAAGAGAGQGAGAGSPPGAGPKEGSPLGPKAPSTIGSYVKPPGPARALSTGRERPGAAWGAGGVSEPQSLASTPGSVATQRAASGWGTPVGQDLSGGVKGARMRGSVLQSAYCPCVIACVHCLPAY